MIVIYTRFYYVMCGPTWSNLPIAGFSINHILGALNTCAINFMEFLECLTVTYAHSLIPRPKHARAKRGLVTIRHAA